MSARAKVIRLLADDVKDAMTLPDMTAESSLARELLEQQIERSFAGREAPNGEKWKRLKAASRSKGGMRAGAIASIAGGTVTPTGFESADHQVFYWKWQDRGLKKTNLPARQFWAIGAKVLDQVTDAAMGRVAKRIADAS